MKKISAFICSLLFSISHYAQDTTSLKEVGTGLRADGKIYVVVAVAVTILLGLFAYLFSLDRKISKMEKQNT
jgi:CcmD family protein